MVRLLLFLCTPANTKHSEPLLMALRTISDTPYRIHCYEIPQGKTINGFISHNFLLFTLSAAIESRRGLRTGILNISKKKWRGKIHLGPSFNLRLSHLLIVQIPMDSSNRRVDRVVGSSHNIYQYYINPFPRRMLLRVRFLLIKFISASEIAPSWNTLSRKRVHQSGDDGVKLILLARGAVHTTHCYTVQGSRLLWPTPLTSKLIQMDH